MRIILIAGLMGLIAVFTAMAQVNTGTISGTVKDSSGAVIAGAKITLLNEDTGIPRIVESDAAGRYSALSLNLGNYRVTGTQAGFQTVVRTGIGLTVGQDAVVDLVLPVGAVTQTLEVAGEAPRIETTDATISGLVTQDQMRDLPLNGRSADDLALLSPGVILNSFATVSATNGFGIRLSVDGARPDSVLYLLDGSVVNDASQNGHGGAAGQALGVEGILEFRILTHNFSAEYGRNAGGVVSSVTRSGTNQFHGSAYEFLRNNDLDARNFFNVGALPAYRRNQFGGAVGGRIIKDKLFFFVNYEGLRQNQENTLISTVPNANARLGILPTGKVTVNPSVTPYLALYPLPNDGDNGDGTGQYLVNAPTKSRDDYAMERIDYRLSDKDSFFLRYAYDPSQALPPGSSGAGQGLPIYETNYQEVSHLATLSETHIFSATSLNEFRVSFNRSNESQAINYLIPIAPSLPWIPGLGMGNITVTGGISQLGSQNGPSTVPQNRFQEGDTFSMTRGAHSLKFGGDVEREQINFSNGITLDGAMSFMGGLQSLLLAQPYSFTLTLDSATSNPERGWRRIYFDGFVQDDWKLRSNLTVNLGLRYETWTSPVEVNGMMSAHIRVTDTSNVPGSPYISPKKGFAPRAGIAWDPTGSGKTSIRAGGGVFFNQFDGRDFYYQATNNSDFTKAFTVLSPVFPHPPLSSLPVSAQQDWSIQYHPQTPTIFQWNFEVQRQLPAKFNVRAAYVGSHGVHLTTLLSQNLYIPQVQPPQGNWFYPATKTFINPNYSTMQQIDTEGVSSYNALQTQLQKTLGAGFQMQLSYTYSKDLSNADQIVTGQEPSGPTMPQNPYNMHEEYGLSALDQRHTLVWNGSYQLPFDRTLGSGLAKSILGGWALNGIYSYGSGRPISIATGFNQARDNGSADRPNLVPGASNNPINGVTAGCAGIPAGQALQTPNLWFDPCAFTLEPAGTYGNLGRYTVTGPGTNTVTAGLVKDTKINERMRLEFRAEFFNLFNKAQFGLPVLGVLTSTGAHVGTAGKITSTVIDNREIQLGMKLIF